MSDVTINVTTPAPIQIGVAAGISERQYPGTYLPNIDLATGVASSYGNGVYNIKQGLIPIPTTLVTENKASLTMRGQGRRAMMSAASIYAGSYSILYGSGGFTGTMIDARGSESLFENFAVHGAAYGQTTRPETAFLISYDNGLGSGQKTFRNLTIQQVTNCFQAGETGADSVCDTSTIERIRARDCRRLLYIKNHQGLGWVSRDCTYEFYGNTDGAMFEYEAGGNLNAYTPILICKADVLRLNRVSTDYGIGSNARIFNIFGLKTDDNAAGSCLVNVVSTPYSSFIPSTVNFFGPTVSGNSAAYSTDGSSHAILRGGAQANFLYGTFQINVAASLEWHTNSFPARANYEGMTLSGIATAADLRKPGSTGTCYLRVNNCWDQSHNPIPDFNGLVSPP